MATAPRKKPATPRNSGSSKRSGDGMSVTFLILILFILAIVVFILAFKEPLAHLFTPGQASTRPIASATTSPIPTPHGNNNKLNQVIVDGGSPSPSPSSAPTPTVSPETVSTTKPSPSASASQAPASTSPKPSAKPTPKTSNKPHSPSPVPTSSPHANVQEDLKSVVLYFTRVQDDGKISIQKVNRSIRFNDNPLTSAIRALLKGPDGTELSTGVVSMIPAGTTLLGGWVSNSVAFLNFSESFQFNPLGAEGLKAQLRQIIWVATEFSTVKSVQILIEGKKVEYLGGDNVFVGKPLTRAQIQ